MTHVEMTHPDMPGRVIRTAEQSIPHRERAGWQRRDDADTADLAGDTAGDDAAGDDAGDETEAGDVPAQHSEGATL